VRKRLTDHRSCIKVNSQNRKTPIGIHFNSIGHNISHLLITPIELINSNNVPQRKARESFWQLTLGTLFPQGLNNFPIHLEKLFLNLLINSPTDLILFWDLLCLQMDNDNTSTPSLVSL
jgi:hypothetical protein